jgi:hypothetical protein
MEVVGFHHRRRLDVAAELHRRRAAALATARYQVNSSRNY